MKDIDRKICEIIQVEGRLSASDLAQRLKLPASTANDRVRRLVANGSILGWRAELDPRRVGAGLCVFVLIDMSHEGEDKAVRAIAAHAEVQELHHISGPHSYLAKLRVGDMAALQEFLTNVIKPQAAVSATETVFAMRTVKETAALHISPATNAE
ncbi:Leucine-responsive regulatory protein [Roseivivax jejudonensis]|uniref:Leucine-responsive regulatory protein n=1 Tax=Roseivivax jejudonensis TaxID=1529041 RepID=A0A1X7A6B9_9RHOB|nr:Lrp/AsnC family transcriptional regulator [Roseivivax jejudonensis]SLN71435.1 Leucine-responsive regulatory protein [Roseivivax jejudonensis]